MNDYERILQSIGLKLQKLSEKKEISNSCECISAYDVNKIEFDFKQLCEKYNLSFNVIDCRNITSHSEIVNRMRTISEFSVLLFTHVTEIPICLEQKNIGWCINSLKNSDYMGIYPMSHMFALLTFLPEELVDLQFDGALYPMPGGLIRFDREWNCIISN